MDFGLRAREFAPPPPPHDETPGSALPFDFFFINRVPNLCSLVFVTAVSLNELHVFV